MPSIYSIGAMNQLGSSLKKAGFTARDITRLKKFENLSEIRSVIRGQAEIKAIEYFIDCDTDLFRHEILKVFEHKKDGQLRFNPSKINLYLSEKQSGDNSINGNKLHKELKNMPVLNANVLDYLLANPKIIPEEWKSKTIFFWGTIYNDYNGDLFVRYLCWCLGKFVGDYRWLGKNWKVSNPAALLAD